MTEEARVENIIMYMPVDVDTVGGTPSSIIKGLKTLPPPRPNAPETHPPMNAKTSRKYRGLPRYLRSPALRTPPFSLSFYSWMLILTLMYVMMRAMTMKEKKMDQSRRPHF